MIGKIVAGERPYLPDTRGDLSPPLPRTLTEEQADDVFNRLIKLTQVG